MIFGSQTELVKSTLFLSDEVDKLIDFWEQGTFQAAKIWIRFSFNAFLVIRARKWSMNSGDPRLGMVAERLPRGHTPDSVLRSHEKDSIFFPGPGAWSRLGGPQRTEFDLEFL